MNLEKIETIIKQGRDIRVLYAEDNSDARTQTLEILKDFFEHVDIAVDGLEAHEKIQNNTYDLIITDINMPKMSGIELISHLRERDDDIAILILSAYNEPTYFIQAIKLGIDGYLLKPLHIDQFIDTVCRTLQQIIIKKENIAYKQSLLEVVSEKTKELEYTYYHDSLTQLPNRLALERDIKLHKKESILLIDINNFAAINNLYGITVGDSTLKSIATYLRELCNDAYSVYRFSGDQFVYLSHDYQELEKCKETAKNIVESLSNNTIDIMVENQKLEINISATIAIVNNAHNQRLFEYADMALEYAKKTHQDIVVYSKKISLEEHYQKDIDAVKLVKKALKEDRLVPFFQPIIKTDGATTYECLARIITDEGKVISPFFFIDGIKKTKYYAELTKMMIRKAFDVFEGTTTSFSLNLSYEDISNEKIITYLKELIHAKKIAQNLILEIVESESIDNFELIKHFIDEMKALGVRIALDDFGSGYSNFSYLMELKPDFIKIDGSLIKEIDINEKSYVITKTIANFSKELNIDVIAEYIHSQEVYDKAKDLGINGFQGYFLGEPVQFITKD